MSVAAESIERALTSSDAEERRQATSALAGLPVEAAVGLLLRALGDEDWRVRKEATLAARALGAAEPLVRALVGVLGEGDNVGLRNAAVDVLAFAGPAATAALAEALGRVDADGRKLAVEALGKGRDPEALAVLEGALGDADDNVRQGAIEAVAALGAVARDRAARILLPRLEDRDRVVQLTALSGLTSLLVPIPWERLSPLVDDPMLRSAALSAAALSESPEAARALAAVLVGARGSTFDLALAALGRLAEGPAAAGVVPALVALRDELGPRLLAAARPDGGGDESAPRRATALRLSAAAALPGVVAVAVAALAEDALAQAALDALTALGPAALPEMIARLDPGRSTLASGPESGPGPRAVLVDAISEILQAGGSDRDPEPEALRALRSAVRDPERAVAVRALVSLSRLGGEGDLAIIAEATLSDARPPAAAAETALAALAARFPAAARALADRLGGGGEASLLPAVIALGAASASSTDPDRDAVFLAHAATAGDPRARRAAVHAVSEIRASAGASFPGALEVLRVALTDEEHEVQIAAARALGRLCTARDALRASDVLDLVDRSGEPHLVAATVRAIGEGLGLAYADPDAPPASVVPPADLVPALGLFARGAPSPVAIAAVEALGQAQRSGAPSVISALAAALDHPDDAVVKAALLKLSAAASAGGSSAPAALDHMARALTHVRPAVRILAVELLAGDARGDGSRALSDEVRRVLAQKIATEPDRNVKQAILRALGPSAPADPAGGEGGG